MACALFLLCVATAIVSSAQTLTPLVNFNGTNGSGPSGSLVQGLDGNLYGITAGGGAYGQGTVFKIAPWGGLTTLYSFCAQMNCPAGSVPNGGLVQSVNGTFYGTTTNGGAHGFGTVFYMTPGGKLTTLYSFCAQTNCTDGANPRVGLVHASDGYFYGTTTGGGTHSGGTIFKIAPSGTLSTIYSFCSQTNCSDGGNPVGGLIQATDGNFYGTTQGGGAKGQGGTVFKITPRGQFTELYSFCSKTNCTDGSVPNKLVQATDGNFYGTTGNGGANGYGTIFEVTPSGTLTMLHSICAQTNCTDGASPQAGLVQATDGNFYGATGSSGSNGYGTVFAITPGGTLATLHSFTGADGSGPLADLIQATNGALYGTTQQGGTHGLGTVFKLVVGLGWFVETLPTYGKVGATIRMLGTNLKGATLVTFGGTTAAFTVLSSTEIQATVPTGATSGYVKVTLASSGIPSNNNFRVTPQITSFAPASGRVGTFVTITGVSLTQTTKVVIGGVSASFTVIDDTTVTATVPTGALTGKISITTAGGSATSTTSFAVTTTSSSQTNNTPFQHVIVIFQENRTPDNLFGSKPNFEPGVNIRNWGYVQGNTNPVQLQPQTLAYCYNPSHTHKAWAAMYDNGKMDGALNEGLSIYDSTCQIPPNPEYVYVSLTSGQSPQPYFDIATNYGFANYMFQTNQGPSFPAHQFIFSGTSAPTYYKEPNDNGNLWWEWFDAENVYMNNGISGCITVSGAYASDISWSGVESGNCAKAACYTPPDPPSANPGFPCFDHRTLVDLFLDQPFNGNPSITWTYYDGGSKTWAWTAPNAIDKICVPVDGTCTGDYFNGKGVNGGIFDGSPAQIFKDISNCELKNVSWVIPEGQWSDHAGNQGSTGDNGTGPSWVGNIVDAIGQNTNCDPGQTNGKSGYWNDTAILVTWDDWGGYYDHVLPLNCNASGVCSGYPPSTNGSRGSEYVYGFRVPLLVVSAYTPPGYVSGPVTNSNNLPISCPIGQAYPYCHDFGSILNFIEYVFGGNGASMGEISPQYHYADYFAPDGPNGLGCSLKVCPYSLSDFFDFKTYGQSPRAFQFIPTEHGASFFLNHSEPALAPDDD